MKEKKKIYAVIDTNVLVSSLRHFPKKPFVVSPTQMVEILYERGYF